MWQKKVMAIAAILAGGFGSILSLGVAFGLDITPDQHTAILAVVSLLVLCLGVITGQEVVVQMRRERAAKGK